MLKKIASLKIAALIGLFLIIGSPAQAQCTCGQCYTSTYTNDYYNGYNGYNAYEYQQMINAYSNALGYYQQYGQTYNQYSPGYNTGNSFYDGGSTSTYHHGDYTDASSGGNGSDFYVVGRGWSY